MCGIAGIVEADTSAIGGNAAILEEMTAAIAHRGPDDQGIWLDPNYPASLGHRRLSVIDLTADGHQPMTSACQRYVLVYNGELYNYKQLRKELDQVANPPSWQSSCDTEVMLVALAHWGVEAALKKFNGMFAFALWDRHQRVLHIARDRIGEKPLYYAWLNGAFVFASELKGLRAHPDWREDIDRNAISLFLRHNYIPAPFTIYRSVRKLLPATYASIDFSQEVSQQEVDPIAYWRASDSTISNEVSNWSSRKTVDHLDSLLRESVELRLASDAPLGAFLSGGIDSSLIVAIMQKHLSAPVNTFSIGFDDPGSDESRYASIVAKHLGTNHHLLKVGASDVLNVATSLAGIYDEPFADASQIPTLLVSQLARKNVTVALSGDGGDELFSGYSRYQAALKAWRVSTRLPKKAQDAVSYFVNKKTAREWDYLFSKLPNGLGKSTTENSLGHKLHTFANVVSSSSFQELNCHLVSLWDDPTRLMQGAVEPASIFTDPSMWSVEEDLMYQMVYADLHSYLPDSVLAKVDRASSKHSLEVRIPIIDQNIVEFSLTIPAKFKIHNGQGKWILRELATRYVPREIIQRPKKGFTPPMKKWLNGPLLEWAEDLLAEDSLRSNGILNPQSIRDIWRQHQSGEKDMANQIWGILMLQDWHAHSRA